MNNILYISYDGMTDPLGQSQVISYLTGLSAKGFSFHLISFEKSERYKNHKNEIEKVLSQANIQWYPLPYTKAPPVLSTIYDLIKLNFLSRKLHRRHNFKLVHCRGYITSLIGLRLKKKYGIKFIFDMRAFYADERVDGGLWPQNKFIYRKIFNYFKRKEIEFLKCADYTISLTQKGREIIRNEIIRDKSVPIEVIPCCVDLDKFDSEKIQQDKIEQLREKLSIKPGQKVLSYVGSIGTWYLPDEMMLFFSRFRLQFPEALFLFITGEPSENIFSLAQKNKISLEAIKVIKGMHHEVPAYLSLSDYSVFFIKPAFSKSGSSPTKMGEIMALGIPLVCNGGVGDVESIVNDTECGVVVSDFSSGEFDNALKKINQVHFDKQKIREGAVKYYSLTRGVELYNGVYMKLLSHV